MKLIIELEPDEAGKYVYRLINNFGKIEIEGQGRSVRNAFLEAIEDYGDCFKEDKRNPIRI